MTGVQTCALPICLPVTIGGVLPAYDIRADKWDIAQSAMTTICNANREKREKKNADKPDANSKINVQEDSKLKDSTQLA